jgi:hypothetical protein
VVRAWHVVVEEQAPLIIALLASDSASLLNQLPVKKKTAFLVRRIALTVLTGHLCVTRCGVMTMLHDKLMTKGEKRLRRGQPYWRPHSPRGA